MWNKTIRIPVSVQTAQDRAGYPIKETIWRRNIPASARSAQRQDQVLAQQAGYSADIVVQVTERNLYGLPHNWSQFTLEDSGDTYEVKRVYHQDKSRLVELTGQLVRRGGTP